MEKWSAAIGNLPFVMLGANTVKPYWSEILKTAVLVGLAYLAAYQSFEGLKVELKEFKSVVTVEMKELKADVRAQIFEVKADIKEIRDDFYKPVVE